ncbi:F-box protein [Aspergillus mulundensis]|uniref:F-box domain-containing protein n=1 Tax=Aspergillus mulundensis TaxID=1810919 RepID=A0A3D8QJ93_9EURO|nr:hypothetical protein DSM5745_10489 [Aspergillus mulundensis]RDW61817.1 hypothetical protein DSM5745_10489 [Aspergillus mulundensis]
MANDSLCGLPVELIVMVFQRLDVPKDAVNLAASSRRLHDVFNDEDNKPVILKSVNRAFRIRSIRRNFGIPKSARDYNFEEQFSVIKRLPPLGWLVRSGDSDVDYEIQVDYTAVSSEMDEFGIRNLADIRSRNPGMTLQEALPIFLGQFADTDKRWTDAFSPQTRAAFAGAAELQIGILEASDLVAHPITDLSGGRTLLALVLHWVAVFDALCIYGGEISCRAGTSIDYCPIRDKGDGLPVTIMRPGYMKYEVHPSITVQQHEPEQANPGNLPKKEPIAGCHDDSDYGLSLRYIVDIFLRLSESEDPNHWPTLTYVLIILHYFPNEYFFERHEWLHHIPSHMTDDIWECLADYYGFCKHDTPLTLHWDEQEYTELVGTGPLAALAIEHMRRQHALWRHGKDEEELVDIEMESLARFGPVTFAKKIKSLALGEEYELD